MNKRNIITIILALAALMAQAQETVTLVGQVQDVFLKRPLVAKISVYETDSTTCVLDSVRVERIEDDNGDIMIAPYNAHVKAIKHDYLIRAELPGYDVAWQKVSVTNTLEKEVLVRYMEGKSYVEIADEMGRHVKSIDNALQRIKRKLQKLLSERDRR